MFPGDHSAEDERPDLASAMGLKYACALPFCYHIDARVIDEKDRPTIKGLGTADFSSDLLFFLMEIMDESFNCSRIFIIDSGSGETLATGDEEMGVCRFD